jgi:hypothetical protein
MAETLALTDHEKLMANPAHGYRRAPGDTYAIGENEYQKTAIASGAGAAATARTNRNGQLVGRPDGK